MRPSDLSAWRTLGTPTLSPDGHHAVLAVTYPDLDADDYPAHLWLVPTDGSAPPRRLTHGWRDSEPAWSPDGRWIAFVRAEREENPTGPPRTGKPQLWVLPADGGEPRRLTDHPLGVSAPVWSPDSTRLAYLARVPEPGRYGTDEKVPPEAEPPRRITRSRYRLDGVGFTFDRPTHVWTVAVEDGEPVQVTGGDHEHAGVSWSPDGQLLTFAAARHDTAGDDLRTDIWVCRPDGSQLRPLTAGGLSAGQPRFAPDGRVVCFTASPLGDDARTAVCRNTGVWSVPLDGGPPRRLTDQERYTLASPGTIVCVSRTTRCMSAG